MSIYLDCCQCQVSKHFLKSSLCKTGLVLSILTRLYSLGLFLFPELKIHHMARFENVEDIKRNRTIEFCAI